MTINQMLEKRAALIKEARGLHDTAQKENRSLSGEEQTKFDKLMSDAEELKADATRAKALEDAEAEAAAPQERRSRPEHQESATPTEAEQRADFHRFMRGEQRAGAPLSTTAAEGGYMAPIVTARTVIDRMERDSFMIAGSNVIPVVGARAVNIPALTTEPDAPAHSADVAETSADTSAVFGVVTLTPVKLSALTYVGNHLISTSAQLAEDFIVAHAAKRMREVAEAGFVAGSGSSAPLGVFNETGALTTREVNGQSETGFNYDDLLLAYMGVEPQYRRNGSWLVSTEFCRRALALKDGEGRPLWLPSLTADKPDTLLGRPVWESASASSTFTADKRIAVFGDFKSGYAIAISADIRVQRLIEKYAEFDATGFLFIAYHDGRVTDLNAFRALHTKA